MKKIGRSKMENYFTYLADTRLWQKWWTPSTRGEYNVFSAVKITVLGNNPFLYGISRIRRSGMVYEEHMVSTTAQTRNNQ